MHWLIKAAIQNSIAAIPDPWSNRLYYAMQRRFGGLRSIAVEDKLRQGIEIAARVRANGGRVVGARALEVGTGRRLNLPLSLWLQGAASIVTVDLNPYLRAELVHEDLRQLSAERARVEALFGASLDHDRLAALVALADDFDLGRLMRTCSIRYLSPGDAARLDLADDSIDLHVSYEVMEHIPGPILVDILREGSRVVADDGLFVHYIDFSDHFSHSDDSISPINFLGYGDAAFRLIAGNRYMYMNRLRLDDFDDIYRQAGHRVVERVDAADVAVARLLEDSTTRLAPRFADKPRDVLATLNAWYVSRGAPRQAGAAH